ncbi:MAG TPA: hypothetical protein VM053_06930 [Gemmatimonadaceae bacterium]|nr:hypothetical protein [Gemmatimonadaceae bacterium]
MRSFRLLTTVLSVGLLACVHARPEPGVDNAVITEGEIAASRAQNAYDAVKLLRGNFLSYRGKTTLSRDSTSSSLPTVYLDDQAFGPVLTLRSIPAGQISVIRLYRSWEATTKYGAGNMGGVIAVETKH